MVGIPHIKIPSVRVGGIDPTSDIGTAIGGVHPAPITYLTQWKIVGNSEVHGQEIWSCGEYNPIDGKYHILVQPLGGSIADIALTEPLRKYDNNIADKIEFPSEQDGKALITRNLGNVILGNVDTIESMITLTSGYNRWAFKNISNLKHAPSAQTKGKLICASLTNVRPSLTYERVESSIGASTASDMLLVYKEELAQSTSAAVRTYFANTEVIYELATPTTELIDAPQIAEADSYSMVIGQGAHCVGWSSFTTESDSE